MTARQTALQIINKCVLSGQYSNIALDTALRRAALSPEDRGFVTVLVYGVLERALTLDHWINALSKDPKGIDPETRNLLRMGLYQLAFLDRVPDHAAVNETVALAPRKTRGFVNAVLRGFLRTGKQLPYPDAKKDAVAYLSARYSFLPALCQAFLSAYGFARTEELFAAFGCRPKLALRVNTLKISRKGLLERFAQAGIEAQATPEAPAGILLNGGTVTDLPGFDEGLFFVQDEASQLCVEALDAHLGMRVLDTCACPGSKSFGAAIDMNNQGEIFSCDLHKNKLSLVESGAVRLGISILQTQARDAREYHAAWENGFDRVLCDVPCSGFGVFAKKPELRYKDPVASAALPQIQRNILNTAASYVKEGGLLVYSTCTLLPCENGENVRAFLQEHTEFELLRERTLYPDTDGTDGFYFAVLGRQMNRKAEGKPN